MHNARTRPLAATRRYARPAVMAGDITTRFPPCRGHCIGGGIASLSRTFSICAHGIEAALHCSQRLCLHSSAGRWADDETTRRGKEQSLKSSDSRKSVYLPSFPFHRRTDILVPRENLAARTMSYIHSFVLDVHPGSTIAIQRANRLLDRPKRR